GEGLLLVGRLHGLPGAAYRLTSDFEIKRHLNQLLRRTADARERLRRLSALFVSAGGLPDDGMGGGIAEPAARPGRPPGAAFINRSALVNVGIDPAAAATLLETTAPKVAGDRAPLLLPDRFKRVMQLVVENHHLQGDTAAEFKKLVEPRSLAMMGAI